MVGVQYIIIRSNIHSCSLDIQRSYVLYAIPTTLIVQNQIASTYIRDWSLITGKGACKTGGGGGK